MCIIEADQSLADLLKRRIDDLLGRSIYDLTHPDDLANNRRLLDRLRSSGLPYSITKRFLRKDGHTVWVRNHVTMLDFATAEPKVLATVSEVEAPAPADIHRERVTMAATLLAHDSLWRSTFLHKGFDGPALNMVLDLYVNLASDKRVSVTSAAMASRVPMTTALRYIGTLAKAGLVARVPDPGGDRRRTLLTLTALGLRQTEYYLDACRSLPDAAGRIPR